MPRKNLRSHLVGGSVAFAILLIGTGAAWAQSGAGGSSAGTSGESGDAATSAGSLATGTFDSTLSTNPLGISPQSSGGQRSSNRRQLDSSEDSAVEGVVRNDSGLRFAPSFSGNSNANANDLSGRPAGGRALGLNANSSNSVPQGGAGAPGNGGGNGNGVVSNLGFFVAHVQSKGHTEIDDRSDGNGNGKALGRNSDASDLTDTRGNGKGKKLGHAKDQFDESSIVQVPGSNPVITDAVAGPARPGSSIIPAVLPAATVLPTVAAAAAVDGLSSPAMQTAPSPVPEPANWLLLALGLAVLAGRALMRRGTLVR